LEFEGDRQEINTDHAPEGTNAIKADERAAGMELSESFAHLVVSFGPS